MSKQTELKALVRKLKRRAGDAYRLAYRFERAKAFEAYKAALGEAGAYDRCAIWLEEILTK